MKLLALIVRGLPAGAIGPYGNRWIDTPTFDAMAAGGVVFDWHLAAHPDHAGARRTWRSGCYHFPLPEGGEPVGPWPDLLAALANHGVATRLVLDTEGASDFTSGWGSVVTAKGMDATLKAARQALDALPADASGLVWVELSALLPPWNIPERFIEPYFATPADEEEEESDEEDTEEDEFEEELIEESDEEEEEEDEPPLLPIFAPPSGEIEEDDDVILAIQTTYAAAVTCLDAALAKLLGDLPDEVAVLLTADHGLALGEHGVVAVGGLHEEIVHVPLLMYGPGWRAGHRVGALTQSVDLAPTLAAFFGAPLPNTQGQSLLGLLALEERRLRDYAVMGLRVGEKIQWGLRTPAWALLLPLEAGAEPILYVKPDDRCEVNSVTHHHLEQADALARTLRDFVSAALAPGPLVPPPLPQGKEGSQP